MYKVLKRKPMLGDYCQASVNSQNTSKTKSPVVSYCHKPAKYLILAFVETPLCEECYKFFVDNNLIDES